MPITSTPERIGAALVVADSDALALLSPDGLTIGTRVFNEDVGHYFRLTKSAQTPITIAPTTDGYDDPQWTFAAATFTGFEGCTLQIVLQAPNEAFNGSFVIDTVDSAHVVTVLDPPAGTTTDLLLAGSAVLFNDALVVDSVVAVAGIIGARWVLDADVLTSWWEQREARARYLLNYAGTQVDTPIPFNFSITKPVLGGGPPTVDTLLAGTVYNMNHASPDTLNFMPDSTAKGLPYPKVTPFYFATLARFATATIGASYAIPLGLDNGTSYIEIALNQPSSTTHFFLLMSDNVHTPLALDLGASCALGSALCPIGVPVTIEVWFDPRRGCLRVAFQETIVASQYAFSGGLDAMPLTAALAPNAQANNVNLAQHIFGGFLMLKGTPI